MAIIFRLLAAIAIFSIIFVSFRSRSHPCEIQVTSGEAISVQSKERIYHKIFNNQACTPDKIVLAVPDNLKSEIGEPISDKGNQEAPKIATLITISDKSNRFFVGRIDRVDGKWIYTKYDTCLAWKWSMENETKVLYLSVERNLQIYSTDISQIVFVISMPFEMIENEPKIVVQPYTWNRVGGFYKLGIPDYPDLAEVLRLVEEDKPEASEVFYPGKEVSPGLAKDLDELDKIGGIHYNRELEPSLIQLDAKAYQLSLQSASCAVPDYLVDPTDPNKCIIAPAK